MECPGTVRTVAFQVYLREANKKESILNAVLADLSSEPHQLRFYDVLSILKVVSFKLGPGELGLADGLRVLWQYTNPTVFPVPNRAMMRTQLLQWMVVLFPGSNYPQMHMAYQVRGVVWSAQRWVHVCRPPQAVIMTRWWSWFRFAEPHASD